MTDLAANVRPASEDAIAEAAAALCAGKLVAFPTETVYGLGADAANDRAVARIFAAKGRPKFNPLIVHVGDLAMAESLVRFNDRARAVAEAFWPGPLTLVLPRKADCPVSRLASAGLDSLAIRLPAHPLALKLLHKAGLPIAAPSANPSGAISPTEASHVAAGLGNKVAIILDGGRCRIGLESTVVGLADGPPVLLRSGGIPREALEDVIGPVAAAPDGEVTAPGMLESHYAPNASLRLNGHDVAPEEALLAFGSDVPAGAAQTLNLSPDGDLEEAAANLFAMLHRLDAAGHARIAVMPVPDVGLGQAINDRLRRAAAPRQSQEGRLA